MDIHCFGCSWSHDLYENSWPKILAKRYPQHTIYNYSMPASDILFSIYCMTKVKPRKNTKNFFIFQGTGSGRISSYNKFLPQQFLIGQGNYKSMDENKLKEFSNFKRITRGMGKESPKFFKQYFNFISDEIIDFEYDVYIKYARTLADYTFTQREKVDGVDCLVTDCFNNHKNYKKYICDSAGQHLGEDGLQKQVDWIEKKLEFLNVD